MTDARIGMTARFLPPLPASRFPPPASRLPLNYFKLLMEPLRADLFDPASLAALGRIEIIARWVVDGFMSGLHRSPRKGFSVEFAEYRPYQPGDDPRYIDWKIAARSDRWVVRQYEEETASSRSQSPVRLLAMTSRVIAIPGKTGSHQAVKT